MLSLEAQRHRGCAIRLSAMVLPKYETVFILLLYVVTQNVSTRCPYDVKQRITVTRGNG